MPIRKRTSAIEREGVNYVRTIVEANNSIFKEMAQQHDYGHDAFVLLVEGEQVVPKEIAMQIKSGASYCTPTTCKIPATNSQLTFWAGHDLVTLGVVYDPNEKAAYWVDLQREARERTNRRREQTGALIEFPKSVWNRFDARMFAELLLPTLQRKTPRIDLETAVAWARSDDFDTHDLGVRILAARHYKEPEAWFVMLALFREREPVHLSPRAGIAFAQMMGHHDDVSSVREASEELQTRVKEQILWFGPVELAKLLFYVDDYGFERPSMGYSLMSVLAARVDSPSIFVAIRDSPTIDQKTRSKAAQLVAIHEDDPRWFELWHKNGK